MKKKYSRLIFVMLLFFLVLASLTMFLVVLKENITFYHTPKDISSVFLGKYLRLGGKVLAGTVNTENGVTTFVLSDYIKEIKVTYFGTLPALFTEDVEIIVGGRLGSSDEFTAQKIFTKHNEIYSRKKP